MINRFWRCVFVSEAEVRLALVSHCGKKNQTVRDYNRDLSPDIANIDMNSVEILSSDDEEPILLATQPLTAGREAAITSSEHQSQGLTMCTICLEPVLGSGDHRVASLRCGHLFGKSCITSWLTTSGSRKRCPQCNKPAKVKDIIELWNLTGVSTGKSSQSHLRDSLEREKASRELAEAEARRLKEQLSALTRQQDVTPSFSFQLNPCQPPLYFPSTSSAQHQQLPPILSPGPPPPIAFTFPPPPPTFSPPLPPPPQPSLHQYQDVGREGPGGSFSLSHPRSPSGPILSNPHEKRQSLNLLSPAPLQPRSLNVPPTIIPSTSQHKRVFEDASMDFKTSPSTRCCSLFNSSLMFPIGEGSSSSGIKVKKLHLNMPNAPAFIQLPSTVSWVRDMAYNPALSLAAMATNAGLLILSSQSHSIVASYDLGSPVWSVSWSIGNPHQIFCGLQNGRLFLVDLRVASGGERSSAVFIGSCGENKQPLHTCLSLPSSFPISSEGSCLVASAGGGVWELGPAAPGMSSSIHPLSLPEVKGWTCESLALDVASQSISVSWRPPLNKDPGQGYSSAPFHSILQRGVREELEGMDQGFSLEWIPVRWLVGHSSSMAMNKGAFLAALSHPVGVNQCGGSGSRGYFVSPDERSGQLFCWDLASGSIIEKLPGSGRILSVASGLGSSSNTIASVSDTTLSLFKKSS